MIKDYTDPGSGEAETEFVASFWDARWEGKLPDPDELGFIESREESRFIERLIPDMGRRSLRILDCGCGTGAWTLFYRSRDHEATGIDIAPRTVDRLRERFGDWFEKGDFRDTGLPADSFDLIINWGGIEHFEDGPMPSIGEAFRLLRPGGWFVASTPCHNLRLFLLHWMFTEDAGHLRRLEGRRFYQYRFTPRELRDQFHLVGFRTIRTRIMGGHQGAWRMLQGELSPLGRLLPARIRDILARALGIMLRPMVGHMVLCGGRKDGGGHPPPLPPPGGAP